MHATISFTRPKQAPLDRLELACAPIANRHWRHRRNWSLALGSALLAELPPEDAAEVAEAFTGEWPEPWLSASELAGELRRCGIHRGKRFFYRLAKRARDAGESVTVRLNSKGQWVNEGGKFAITASCEHESIRFQLHRAGAITN